MHAFGAVLLMRLRAASASNQLKISGTAPRMHIRFYGTPPNRTFTREAAIKINHSLFRPIFRRDSPAIEVSCEREAKKFHAENLAH